MSEIRRRFQRNRKAVELKGRRTVTERTVVRLREDLTCEIEAGQWKVVSDLPDVWGGKAKGPTPGFFLRGAFGSCLAQCCRIWAEAMEIPLRGVEVEIEVDHDPRGMFDLDDMPAGDEVVRYVLTIESDAPEEDIRRLVKYAESNSPVFDDFSRALSLEQELRIVRPEE